MGKRQTNHSIGNLYAKNKEEIEKFKKKVLPFFPRFLVKVE